MWVKLTTVCLISVNQNNCQMYADFVSPWMYVSFWHSNSNLKESGKLIKLPFVKTANTDVLCTVFLITWLFFLFKQPGIVIHRNILLRHVKINLRHFLFTLSAVVAYIIVIVPIRNFSTPLSWSWYRCSSINVPLPNPISPNGSCS